MNRRSKTLLILGGIVILVTIIISILCIKDWSGLTPFTFAVMLWAEAVLFAGLVVVENIVENTEQVMLRSSYTVLLTIYSATSFIVAIIFLIGFKQAIIAFSIIQLLLLAAIAIVLIVFYTASKGVGNANQRTMAAVVKTDNLINRLNKMAVSDEGKKYASTLSKLSDDLRFTDTSSIAPEDEDIDCAASIIEMELVKPTEEVSDDKIRDCLLKLNSLIAQRKLSVSAGKKGRI